MEAQDIILDEDFDLQLRNGDFVIGESDFQHQRSIVLTSPGEWRQWPLCGANVIDYIRSNDSYRRNLLIQLERDGYQVLKLDTSDLQAPYINAIRR